MGDRFINHQITSDTVSRDVAECPIGLAGAMSMDITLIDKLIDISTPSKDGYVIGNALVVLTNIHDKFDILGTDILDTDVLDEYRTILIIMLLDLADASDLNEAMKIVGKAC